MGKRSNFKRKPRDFYPTPEKPLLKLLPHLPKFGSYIEPCAGDGILIDHIKRHTQLVCTWASDIKPMGKHIEVMDALNPTRTFLQADLVITNTPWDRKFLHPFIEIYRNIAPTWLLFDADWKHTKQAKPYLPYCHKVVSVGRVSWEQNGVSGKDNCAWYLFGKEERDTIFYGNV